MAGRNCVTVLAIWIFVLWNTEHTLQQAPLPPATIGSSCGLDERCTKDIPNSFCSQVVNLCACKDSFVPHPMNTSCLPVAKSLGDPCQETIQCNTNIENSICSDQGTCICKPNHHDVTSTKIKCVISKGINDSCTDKSECYLEDDGDHQNIICDDNKKCNCKPGSTLTADERSCKSSGTTSILSVTCLLSIIALHLVTWK
ncbi:uncharacterized protein [Periplaneta americana]|uniref:uncharacterized protein n=1 Tax=Periplaneta americana TaxID=6978 RepID=UPI0037E8349C